MSCKFLDAACTRRLMARLDVVIFDCDGVLWRGEDGLLPGTVETIAMLEDLGKTCVFVTNNAAKSRAAYAEKFAGLGLENVSMEQVVPSAHSRSVLRPLSAQTNLVPAGHCEQVLQP